MNFLTALMPGVRQLRTPLASGALWIFAGYLAYWPHRGVLDARFPALVPLLAELSAIETVYRVGMLAFLAYLVGSMIQDLAVFFAGIVKQLVRAVEARVAELQWIIVRRWRSTINSRSTRFPVRSVVMDAVSHKYAAEGFPSNAYLSFPFALLEDQLEPMSLQIWHKAADQYQESDRLRGESDFRVGVALPLLVLGIEFGFLFTWLITVIVALGSVVLILQSRKYRWERRALLANAFYQGLAESATLDGTVRALGAMKLPERMDFVLWFEATAIALGKAGSTDGYEMALDDGATEVCDEINFGAEDWEDQVLAVVQRIQPIFDNADGQDDWVTFLRKIEMRQMSAKDALDGYALGGDVDAEVADRVGRRGWRRGG